MLSAKHSNLKEVYSDIIIDLFNKRGIYSFSTQGIYKYKVPYFCIKMKKEDIYNLKLIKRELKLKSKIYTYEPARGKDGYTRSATSMLIIRDIGELKDIIIPKSTSVLVGEKRSKFLKWLKQIRSGESVPSGYKLMASMFKISV